MELKLFLVRKVCSTEMLYLLLLSGNTGPQEATSLYCRNRGLILSYPETCKLKGAIFALSGATG